MAPPPWYAADAMQARGKRPARRPRHSLERAGAVRVSLPPSPPSPSPVPHGVLAAAGARAADPREPAAVHAGRRGAEHGGAARVGPLHVRGGARAAAGRVPRRRRRAARRQRGAAGAGPPRRRGAGRARRLPRAREGPAHRVRGVHGGAGGRRGRLGGVDGLAAGALAALGARGAAAAAAGAARLAAAAARPPRAVPPAAGPSQRAHRGDECGRAAQPVRVLGGAAAGGAAAAGRGAAGAAVRVLHPPRPPRPPPCLATLRRPSLYQFQHRQHGEREGASTDRLQARPPRHRVRGPPRHRVRGLPTGAAASSSCEGTASSSCEGAASSSCEGTASSS